MHISNTIVLLLFTTICFAQKEHSMFDNASIYWHEYEQELLSELLSTEVQKVETFEKNHSYYKSDLEFIKSIRHFDSNGKDSLTIFKAIDGSILNQLRFEYQKNKIVKIIVNDNEDTVVFKYLNNKISYSNGRDSTIIKLDSQNRIINEISDDIETKNIYNEIDNTKKIVFPPDYADYNQVCYYTFKNGFITNIKTVALLNNEAESNVSIENKFDGKGFIR